MKGLSRCLLKEPLASRDRVQNCAAFFRRDAVLRSDLLHEHFLQVVKRCNVNVEHDEALDIW